MKFLVTGAGGQLGSEWVEHLKKKGVDFIAYKSNEFDISNEEKLRTTFEKDYPDVVINCAAYTKVDEAEDNQRQASVINSQSVKVMAGVCNEMNIKLVHYSTDYVFAGTKEDMERYPEGYTELNFGSPVNEYGLTKLKGENAIKESGCKYLIIRVSWLCGKYGNNFVKTMLRFGKEKKSLTIVNDQFGSPSFAENIVQNTMVLLRMNEEGVFHLTSKGLISWFDLAHEIFKQSQYEVNINPVPSSEYPTKAKRPSFSKLNTDKIATIKGIEIESWKEGLTKLLEQLDS